jgi:hypothetical protein
VGLDINIYSYSYRTLHRLREVALALHTDKYKLMCGDYGVLKNCGKCAYCQVATITDYDEIKKICGFPEFIDHSDCDGGYISEQETNRTFANCNEVNGKWGSLDRLRDELNVLKQKFEKTTDDKILLKAFEEFCEDAFDCHGVMKFR